MRTYTPMVISIFWRSWVTGTSFSATQLTSFFNPSTTAILEHGGRSLARRRLARNPNERSSDVVLREFHDHKHRTVGTVTKNEDDGSRTWCDALGLCQQFIGR